MVFITRFILKCLLEKETNYMYKNPSIEKSILNTEKQYHSEISQHYTQSAALDAI